MLAASLVVLLIGGRLPAADESTTPKRTANSPPPRKAAADERGPGQGQRTQRIEAGEGEREVAALAFVRENHPELAELLEQLKAMKPEQYDRAINELWQVSRTMANYKKNNEQRYRLALDVWKTKSRAELIAAQLVGTPSTELEGQLRGALESQLDAEIRLQRFEREQLKERLRKLDETIDRMESRRDKLIESRYQAMVKKGQRAGRREAGRSTPSGPALEKGDPQE